MTDTIAQLVARVWPSTLAGLLAWFFGKALNVPAWRNWEIGDRTDLAILAFALVFSLTKRAHDGGSNAG